MKKYIPFLFLVIIIISCDDIEKKQNFDKSEYIHLNIIKDSRSSKSVTSKLSTMLLKK